MSKTLFLKHYYRRQGLWELSTLRLLDKNVTGTFEKSTVSRPHHPKKRGRFSGFSKPRFWGTCALHPGFSWFPSFPCFLWFPRIQQSTPLLVAVWVVFVIFVIPVVFVKSTELQNLGLAKPRFRDTRDSQIAREAVWEPHPGPRSILDLASSSGKIKKSSIGDGQWIAMNSDSNRAQTATKRH